MSDRAYRQRLEADLGRWQADGVIAPEVGDAIRRTFRPVSPGIDIATVVAILGGLLIAAAFLAFIAANWTSIPRPTRFLILLVGIAGAYGVGAWFDRTGRATLADLAAGVGSIIFGAAIALVGQMYHLGDDFAGGMALFAGGALAAAVLTGSRAALAVALVAACIWNGMRVFELSDIHWPLAGFCLVGAILAVAWNAPVARHLVAIAAFAWWISSGIGLQQVQGVNPTYTVIVGASLLLGIGLALASRGPESLTKFGLTLSTYASFAFSIALALVVSGLFGAGARNAPAWFTDCSIAGLVLAFLAAAISRRAGPAFAGLAIGLALAIYTGWLRPLELPQPWSNYGLLLVAMLCLIISGMLDEVRARVVAGWLGLALMIAAITWAVRASLLQRAFFLAVAGSVAVMLAITLGRLLGRERAS